MIAISIVLMLLPLIFCTDYPCPHYTEHSIKENCAGCGICIIDNTTRTFKSKCFYNELDYFKEGVNCNPVLYCQIQEKANECKGLKCLNMLGTFRCQCGLNTFGRLCEHKMTEGLSPYDFAVVDDIIFTPVTFLGEPTTVSVIFSKIGKNLLVDVESDFEFYRFDNNTCEEVAKDQFCMKLFRDYPDLCERNIHIKENIKCALTIQVIFDAIVSLKDEIHEISKPNETYVLGGKQDVKVNIKNNYLSHTLFSYMYKVVNLYVGKSFYGCDPRVSIRNVGKTMWKMIEFTARDKVVITGSYQLKPIEKCSNPDNIKLHWTVWQLYINHNDLSSKPLKEVFGSLNVKFPAFFLKKGMYKVNFNVSVWNGDKLSFKFRFGYFKVIAMDLLPVIAGGEERAVFYNVKVLKLDGSLSRDPNVDPSKQQDILKFYWKCDKPIDFCKEKESDNNIFYPGPFKKNELYTFYLTVVSSGDETKRVTTSQKVFMMPTEQYSIEVVCKKNCGGVDYESNPGNIIYLEAVIMSDSAVVQSYKTSFVWSYKTEKEDNFKPVDEIRQSNTPDNVLIILKNSLSEGEIYSIQAKGKSEALGGAKFKVKIASKISAFTCNTDVSLEKTTILRGVTKLKVVCDMLKFNNLAPIYDFYDRYVDVEDSGRLIVSGKSNIADDVVLTRGKLVVEVTNEYGMVGISELVIKLQNTTNVTEIVQEELKNLQQNSLTSDAEFKINTISIVLDLIDSKTYNVTYLTNIIEYMLQIASTDEIGNIPILKIWTDLVNRIAKEDLVANFTTKSITYLSKAITKLSEKLLFEIRIASNETEINDLTYETVHRLSLTMFKICNTICNSSNKDIIERKLNEEEDSYSLHASYRESSDLLVTAVGRIMLCLALKTLPHELPITMNEKSISIFVKEDAPESFSTAGNDSVKSVVIPKDLARSISQTANTIIVLVAEYKDNPYWYNIEFDIHTHAVDLQIRFKKGNRIPFIEEILYPVYINLQHFKTVNTIINGSVCQPNANISLDMADQAVVIHQIRAPFIGKMNLKFLDLEEDHVIRLKVLFNKRPDYDYMTLKNVTQITKSSPTYTEDLKDPHSHDVYDLYYIGILPGMNIPSGECLNYSFEMSVLHCVTWKFHEWSTGGCKVQRIDNSGQLQCKCEHLSTFAGFSQVPINSVDPFEDYKLFFGLKENPYVFILLVFILSVYFILLIWALRKDRKEKLKGGAVYLEDNFPRDPFPYLIAVYTGNKLFSGTTSKVGIVIEGEDAGSRPHLLKSSSHRTLETGDDNWFIIFTPYYLGDLTMIHLWIDYSGKSPEWFCHKIMVIDLMTYKEYVFLVDTWMSLKGDDFVERFVEVSKSHEEHRINNTINNIILGFRETHLWMSVLARHPRSSVTRAQRLSLAFTGLLVTMLVSCMFYGVLEENREDYSNYSFTIRELVVAVMSLVVSSTLINIVVSFFRRSLVLKQYDEEFMLEVEEDENVKKTKSKKKAKLKKQKPLLRFFEDVLKIITKPKKFKPVLINIEEINTKQKRKVLDVGWSLLSWSICFVMICFCSYFIALYGLKFGKVKSLEWLTSVFFSLLQIIFIVAPFRIISLASISGMLSTKMYDVVSYRIQPHLLEKCKLWQLNSNPNLDSKLINIRSQQFYLPLSYKQVTNKFYKQKRKLAVWLLLDMVLILLLIILIFIQNEMLWTTKYYWNNQQLTTLLRQGYEEEGIQMYSLTNLTFYSLFLEEEVFPVIYQSKWYNGLPIIERNTKEDFRFVFSGTSKLFGLPRLRQIRLKPDLCEKPIYENLSQYCNVKLTEDTEDTNLYAEGWVETGPHEKFLKMSPWNYMNDSETYDTTLFGYSNIAYKGDGYVAELDVAQEKAEDIVIMLHREKWLDRRTAVVIFELTLYNAFSGTLSWLISVTENLHIGMLMNRVYVFTVSDSYKFPIVDIICFVALLMFIVRVFFIVNRNGLDTLLHTFWNIFEVVIVCLAVACTVLYFLNLRIRSDYLNIVMTGDDREKYFEYFHLLEYLDEFRSVLLFLIIALVCRFMMSFRFGKSFTVYFDCMVYDWKIITWIFAIFTIFLFTHWRIFSYLMNNYTLSKMNNFLIISKVDFKQLVKNCSHVQCKFVPFVLCSVSYAVLLIIICYLVVTFRIVKRKLREKDYLNFCTVFCEKNDFPLVIKDTKRNSRVLKLA